MDFDRQRSQEVNDQVTIDLAVLLGSILTVGRPEKGCLQAAALRVWRGMTWLSRSLRKKINVEEDGVHSAGTRGARSQLLFCLEWGALNNDRGLA